MENGNTMQRKEATLHVEYRVQLRHRPDSSISYTLVFSYSTEEDTYPISQFNAGLATTKSLTYKLACQVSKLYEDSGALDTWWKGGLVSEESWLSGALASITLRDKKALDTAVSTLCTLTESHGFRWTAETAMHSVACSIKPTMLADESLGYEVRLSYSSDDGMRPLLLSTNPNFVSQSTLDFADFFTSEMLCPEFYDIEFSKVSYRNHALCMFMCPEESLVKLLELLQRKAEDVQCKLSLVALPGGPGWQYPKISRFYNKCWGVKTPALFF
ncbi:MAG: hypothetical protein IKE01_05595 [Clostridia bacterium]|nr:hypothetical protein [Clostridia bacterium]